MSRSPDSMGHDGHGRVSMAQLGQIARRAMQERGLEPDFPPGTDQQLAVIRAATPAMLPGTRDLRALPWCSIDNDDSRDLDQLTVAQPAASGATRILVAIADVDARVPPATPIDAHAAANTTSVYTAAGIFPMLPEALSTDLSSLGAGVERASIVMDLTVAPGGEVIASELYPARVVNRAKLAYDSVAAWLDARGPAPAPVTATPGMDEQLRTQDRVAQAMRAERSGRGALELDTLEARAVLNQGVLSDLRPDTRNRAHELIEYFMIAANEAAAGFLEQHRFPSLRRVLPVPERWERIVALARGCGDDLPARPDAAALNAFLLRRRAADPARFADLSLAVVKLLGSGAYAMKEPGKPSEGHFGLASSDYAHCTAPNRRYPDVIMQRLIKAALTGGPPPLDAARLRGLAAHCSLQERAAAHVERQVRKSAAAALLAGRIGESFDAVVTGVSSDGTWVRINAPLAEGRLVHGQHGLDVGDALRVRLAHTDIERGFIDFERLQAGGPPAPDQGRGPGGGQRSD